MAEINCVGDICPIPVIKAKKALEGMNTGELVVIVDNEIAAQNLEKLAKEKGCEYSVEKSSGEPLFRVSLNKIGYAEKCKDANIDMDKPLAEQFESIVVISSDKMGEGDESFGHTLLKGFIYALCESEKVPDAIIFYNKGAFFTDAGSECLEDLENLKEKGAEVLTCGACIDFYGLKLGVGEVTNMYEIVERLMAAGKVVRP